MKIRHIVLVVATVVAGKALASSVELSGVVDVSIRHSNNADGKGRKSTYMTDGQLSNSAVSIKVTEDINPDLQAIAKLELGFDASDGSQNGLSKADNTQGIARIFNREATVGFKSPSFGQLTFGRQKTIPNIFVSIADPTGLLNTSGHYTDKSLTPTSNILTARRDSTIYYMGNFDSPFSLHAAYSFGGVPGNMARGSTWAGGLTYEDTISSRGAHIAVVAGFERHTMGGNRVAECSPSVVAPGGDNPPPEGTLMPVINNCGMYRGWQFAELTGNKREKDTIVGGASIKIENIKFSLGAVYQNRKGLILADDTTKTGKDRRLVFFGGVTYGVTPELALTAAYYNDRYSAKNTLCTGRADHCSYTNGAAFGPIGTSTVTGAPNLDGRAQVFVFKLEYAVSKRTDVYAMVDHTRVKTMDGGNGLSNMYFSVAKAAKDNTAEAKNTRNGISLGIRHKF